ncbi:GNAT family N-acetyltransferase [Oceanobacillus locisalsi]|uniref:GNAT family N-acetyltransferase n=1 Tax=Oceanobacillus locisalsi TaxID=546107 RepID=A0ABW3NM59_9BACI
MIREATSKDLPAILEIYNDAILHTTAVYSYQPQTLANREAWFKQKKDAGYPILVNEQDGNVAGFATFGPFRDWPAYKYSIEHSVYVDKRYRKKGIASSLMKEIIAIACEREYMTMIAGIDAANEKSIALHEKFGFEHVGTIKNAGFKFKQWMNLAFYQLEFEGPENPTEA